MNSNQGVWFMNFLVSLLKWKSLKATLFWTKPKIGSFINFAFCKVMTQSNENMEDEASEDDDNDEGGDDDDQVSSQCWKSSS